MGRLLQRCEMNNIRNGIVNVVNFKKLSSICLSSVRQRGQELKL